MTEKEQGLPELPSEVAYRISWNDRSYRGGSSVSFNKCHQDDGTSEPLFTADQMRAYALAALASDTGERGVVDENDLAAVLLASNVDGDTTLSDLLQIANFSIGERLTAGLNLARAALRAQPAGGGGDELDDETSCATGSPEWQRGFNDGREQGRREIPLTQPQPAGGGVLFKDERGHGVRPATPPESGWQGQVAGWLLKKQPNGSILVMRDHFGFEVSEGPHHLDRHVHKFLSDIITHPLYTHPPAQASGAVTEAMKLADELDEWARQYQLDGGYSNPTLIAAARTIRSLAQGGGNER